MAQSLEPSPNLTAAGGDEGLVVPKPLLTCSWSRLRSQRVAHPEAGSRGRLQGSALAPFPTAPPFLTVLRDISERGRDLEQILTQYITFVKPAFEEFCLPVSAVPVCFVESGL